MTGRGCQRPFRHNSRSHLTKSRCETAIFPHHMVIYPLAVIADVATDVWSSRARLRFANSTRIVVMCKMIEKGTK
jgi:hypothetical protein